jgi:RecJ-like exonuclease
MADSTPREMRAAFEEAAGALRERLVKGERPLVVTHHDADGLTAGAILHRSLLREGFPVHTRCVDQLEHTVLEELGEAEPLLLVFTDIGSGILEGIRDHIPRESLSIVLDHHQPQPLEAEGLYHINPHDHGIDGAREVSGSGMAYLFAKAFHPENRDLAALAIVGAVGDLQDASGELLGLNREIQQDGIDAGVLRVEKDLRLFGRQTRPLYKAIEYTTEPFIPSLSGSESASLRFLSELDIPAKKGDQCTLLTDLTAEERQRLVTALILTMIEHKIPPSVAERIVGDVYTLPKEEERTPLRDAKEFATLLNGCGKRGEMGVGLAVCLGERGALYQRALEKLKDHKGYLSSCYNWISQNLDRIEDREAFYHLSAGKEIDERVIGTVASMVLNSRVFPPIKPILAFSETEKGEIKVSSRGTRELVEQGLNLGKVMTHATAEVGGEGGGHDIAAGARIQKGKEEEFLRAAGEKIREQLPHLSHVEDGP